MTKISVSENLMGDLCVEMGKLEVLKELFDYRLQSGPMAGGESRELSGGISSILYEVTKAFWDLQQSYAEDEDPEEPVEEKPEFLPKESTIGSIGLLVDRMNPQDIPEVLTMLQGKITEPAASEAAGTTI